MNKLLLVSSALWQIGVISATFGQTPSVTTTPSVAPSVAPSQKTAPAQSDGPQQTAVSGAAQEGSLRPVPEGPPPLAPLPEALAAILKSAVPLNPEKTVLLDTANKRVLLHTQVACEDCPLEMFCCIEQTKEHESVLWMRGRAFVVHSALLALNAKPGEPALFTPVLTQPWGQKIDVFVNWVDKDGKLQRATAQSWVRHTVSRYYSAPLAKPPEGIKIPYLELRYDPYNKEVLWYGEMTAEQRDELLGLCPEKNYQAAIQKFFKESQTRPMKAEFVFAGSYHYVLDGTDEKVYAAEGGYLLCVANFAGSLIDVTEVSSASDGGQSYEAWPGKVPPQDTPVIVELVPTSEIYPKQPSAAADKTPSEKK